MSATEYLGAVGGFSSDPMAAWSMIRAAGADMDPVLHACAILMESDIVCVGSGSADFATVFWARGHPPASPEDIRKVVFSGSEGCSGRVVILQDAAGLHCYGTATASGGARRVGADAAPALTLALDFTDWAGDLDAGGDGPSATELAPGPSATELAPDRTLVPELENGDRLWTPSEVEFALRQADWIGCILRRADQVLFKFGPEGWFVGGNLKKGKDKQSKDSLVVRYDDGDQVAHSEFDAAMHGTTYWFVGRLATSPMV